VTPVGNVVVGFMLVGFVLVMKMTDQMLVIFGGGLQAVVAMWNQRMRHAQGIGEEQQHR
jgi:hypothetical protein